MAKPDDWEAVLVKGYEPSKYSRRERVRTTIVVITILFVLGGVTWLVSWLHSQSSGDPGGRVMNQLTPAVTSLPGYGTAALPWVSQQPTSLVAPYIIEMEPYQDSCDGRAGTQGWSQVVVQSKFRWERDLSSLVAHMEPRLATLGWRLRSAPALGSASWTKTLNNGTPATLSLSGEEPGYWQLDAEGEPIGRGASGC